LIPTSITIGETGWQAAIPPSSRAAYFGIERVGVTTEEAQAQIYSQLVRATVCDPDLRAAYFFMLIDEPDLDRFQTGLIRADGSKRASYFAVKRAIAETNGSCTGKQVSWRPTLTVVGARVDFGKLPARRWKQRWWGFKTTADEEAAYRAGIYRLAGRKLAGNRRRAILRNLAGLTGGKSALATKGLVKAYWSPLVRYPSKRLKPGYYVYGIALSATMTERRTSTFLSRPFLVKPRVRRR